MPLSRPSLPLATLLCALVHPLLASGEQAKLLFHVSADHGTTADTAAPGTAEATFVQGVDVIAKGARGPGLSCDDRQQLAWKAPGNIYSQRGTLSFFWRSRYPVGPTEFPVFRVGFGDHSSWDMVWLRIDYNGAGFDAFVTDANLARTRVSVKLPAFPSAETWTHLALSWDETFGIKFYINGKPAAEQHAVARFDSALDQFGPHSRVISPYQVQSDYNFTRGGDIDEIRIYDQMLSDEAIATLASTTAASPSSEYTTASPGADALWQAFRHRYGFDAELPALAPGLTSVRKVEIHDAYDLKRWWWKGTDGIRETTWPGVYNRSRLPGRNDYFHLPDWDCYSLSGKAVTFTLPDEPWNHLEISGAAFGKGELVSAAADGDAGNGSLFVRPRNIEKSVHRSATHHSGKIRFTNDEQETPIGEFEACFVGQAPEPSSTRIVSLHFDPAATEHPASTNALARFIEGRHPTAERTCFVALPGSSKAMPSSDSKVAMQSGALPLLHLLIPWEAIEAQLDGGVDALGLDGIAVDFPKIGDGSDVVPANLQVKDPLWPMRDALDFTFSIDPKTPHTLWLDLRDRILPSGKPIYLTLAYGATFRSPALPSTVRLHFKPRAEAVTEHVADRFTQLRDSYAMLVEEHPRSENYNLWNRFKGDLDDLLRVEPQHRRALEYLAAVGGENRVAPITLPPKDGTGAPLWARYQVELLRAYERFVLYYIDQRQIENGEMGGGLSDDTDLLNFWPGAALLGIEPKKVTASVHRLLEACYAQGMFTNGISTIQTDELHSYEEGINALGQALLLEYGSPRQLERAMESARGTAGITAVNTAGHRHIRSTYFSGSRVAEEDPWGGARAYSHLIFHPTQLLAQYNGNAACTRLLTEVADGLLAHRVDDGKGGHTLNATIHFTTDRAVPSVRPYLPVPLFATVHDLTGDTRYLTPIFDAGLNGLVEMNTNILDGLADESWRAPLLKAADDLLAGETQTRGRRRRESDPALLHYAWQLTKDTRYLETLYQRELNEALRMEYINTEGSIWIDRVGLPVAELQRARLGGVALTRNHSEPGHVISWEFEAPARADQVGILVEHATPKHFRILAHNLGNQAVRARVRGGQVEPGEWTVAQRLDAVPDSELDSSTHAFERGASVLVTLPPHVTTAIEFTLKAPGVPYSQRPDLGIDPDDIVVKEGHVSVTVHSVGAVASPKSMVALVDADGAVLARANVGPLGAPDDLMPKTATVTIDMPPEVRRRVAAVVVDPVSTALEITRNNNAVPFTP